MIRFRRRHGMVLELAVAEMKGCGRNVFIWLGPAFTPVPTYSPSRPLSLLYFPVLKLGLRRLLFKLYELSKLDLILRVPNIIVGITKISAHCARLSLSVVHHPRGTIITPGLVMIISYVGELWAQTDTYTNATYLCL